MTAPGFSSWGLLQARRWGLSVAEVVAYNALLAALAEGTGSVCCHPSQVPKTLRPKMRLQDLALNPKP